MNQLRQYSDFDRWSVSILPALVGTTLPFWLRTGRFSFDLLGAVEFLLATALFHAGFSFLLTRVRGLATEQWPPTRLLFYSLSCIFMGCLLGLHLYTRIPPVNHVPDYIFLVFGAITLVIGFLYVLPPARLHRWPGGEILVAEGFGMIPVLGAFLVQVGDLNRTVYLAAFPVIALSWIWVWTVELSNWRSDEEIGRQTLVHLFGRSFSGRIIAPLLCFLPFGMLIGAVITRSLPPISLIAMVLIFIPWRIAASSREDLPSNQMLDGAIQKARILHALFCFVLILSLLSPLIARMEMLS